MYTITVLSLCFLWRGVSLGVEARQEALPTVTLDAGIFTGINKGSTNQFLGVPFAKPPVGNLRFRRPELIEPYNNRFNATAFGNTCILQNLFATTPLSTMNPIAVQVLEGVESSNSLNVTESEDCLFVNIFAPTNATISSKYPVVFWIYGSAFADGSSTLFDGSAIVNRSLELGTPVVYVSLNHRMSSLGFSGGEEVKEAGIGNLGFLDQRLAMRWVQKYISAFGGDPERVMIWGESAGATAVQLHMLANGGNTEGLFRAAFMHSVAAFPDDYDIELGQAVFDQFAIASGCGSSLRSPAVFDCLRALPISTIQNATDLTPSFFGYSVLRVGWRPYVDGSFLTASPYQLISDGRIANIPFVIGNAEDEATIFTLAATNITTDDEFSAYLSSALPKQNDSTIRRLLDLYPADPAAGSPFETGAQNAITPEYKRTAALLGDALFQAPRRFFLRARSQKQPAYGYLYSRFKSTPYLGTYHSVDDVDIYGPGDLTDAIVRFAVTLDPNGALNVTWPRYEPQTPQLFRFLDGDIPFSTINDTFRTEGIDEVIGLSTPLSRNDA